MYNAQLLREILDAQLEMVCRFQRDGTILFVNRAYADTLGKSPAELTGNSLWQFVSPQDRAHVETQLDQLRPDHAEITIENRFETAAGLRWILWRNHALEFDANGALLVAQSSGFDISDRKLLEEQRQLLIDELNHRVRNTLAVVQGMASQSFRDHAVPAAALDSFHARLHALAAAHTILSNESWVGAGMLGIVRQGLAICGEAPDRITVAGPDVKLRPGAAVALVLVLHELATNAVKYGALSGTTGQVSVHWRRSGEQLALDWIERDGPPVIRPERRGFGSRLLESSVRRQLGGELDLEFAPTGLRCAMIFPLTASIAVT